MSLSIGHNLLGQLIGDGQSVQLLQTLGIAASPSIQLVKTPLSVSNLLHQAFTRHLTGPMRKLHSQAKCLEYLAGLCHAFVHPPSTVPDRKAIDRAE
ncbi:hypothetical protein GJ668_19055 [Allochromatium palmeri]|uniref:Uncharacterized protein n=1 Tax=Allochromatium palmeri TaxID=231048 RepID=A0A6N8EHN7_9GAMM|nr:hypothetical protein [Allochromatium palmeri]